MDSKPEPDTYEEDTRPFWRRLLRSLRPTVAVETSKKTGERIGTIGIKGGTDF